MEKTVKLTTKEINMITKALDSYGDKVADTQGYSAGEKYWELMEKLKRM